MHRGGVHAGAHADDQHRCPRLGRTCNQRAQELRGNMAQGVALRLKIVQDCGLVSTGCAHQQGRINRPVQIGHHRDTVAHRACRSDANAVHFGHTGLCQILPQNRLKAGIIGIRESGDAAGAHHGAIGKCDTGVGAANIGNDGKRGGHIWHL